MKRMKLKLINNEWVAAVVHLPDKSSVETDVGESKS